MNYMESHDILVVLLSSQSESSSQTGSSSDSDSESTLESSDEDFEEQLRKVKVVRKCGGRG